MMLNGVVGVQVSTPVDIVDGLYDVDSNEMAFSWRRFCGQGCV